MNKMMYPFLNRIHTRPSMQSCRRNFINSSFGGIFCDDFEIHSKSFMNSCRYEVIASFILWIGAVFYSIYGVIRVRKAFEDFDDIYGDFQEGWLVKSVKKDAADYEWETTITLLLKLCPWLVAHIVFSEYLRQTYCKALPYWQLSVAVLVLICNTGIFGITVIAAQPIIFECAYKFKRKLIIWICSGFCLILISYLKSLSFNEYQSIQINESQHYLIIITVCWMNLRCLSYYIDHLHSEGHSIIQVLSYCFYLPTLFLGPFIPFSDFEKSQKYYKIAFLKERINGLLYNVIHYGFWLIFTEFSLHYVFVNVLSFHPELVKSLDNWSLYGYGYCMGQFFHLKYVVIYGLSTSLSKFEHIETPSIPKCIGRIHLYSDMWKYFDGGLYKFLVRYIYLPTQRLIDSKIFSSFLCFLFIFVWHGVQYHILVWAILNFIGILIEHVFTSIGHSLQFNSYLCNEKLKHRLLCIITSPLLAMSAVSNFYFFAGTEIGNIFVDRFINSSMSANLILLFFLCCCCSVSTEVRKWEKCLIKKA